MDFFERLARAWNVLWGLEESPPREAFDPSPPPPAGIGGRTVSPLDGRPPSIRMRERQREEPKKLPAGIAVRVVLTHGTERVGIPVAFDPDAVTETLVHAPATLVAGSGVDEEEMIREMMRAMRGTPALKPNIINLHFFEQVGGTLLFGSSAHLVPDVKASVSLMARVLGEIRWDEGQLILTARKGLGNSEILVEPIDGSAPRRQIGGNSPPFVVPPCGVYVYQIVGFDKTRGFAPRSSKIAWEIGPLYH